MAKRATFPVMVMYCRRPTQYRWARNRPKAGTSRTEERTAAPVTSPQPEIRAQASVGRTV